MKGDAAGGVSRRVQDAPPGPGEVERLAVGEGAVGPGAGDGHSGERAEVAFGITRPRPFRLVDHHRGAGKRGEHVVDPGDVIQMGVGEHDRLWA